jgi:hypothetical protein
MMARCLSLLLAGHFTGLPPLHQACDAASALDNTSLLILDNHAYITSKPTDRHQASPWQSLFLQLLHVEALCFLAVAALVATHMCRAHSFRQQLVHRQCCCSCQQTSDTLPQLRGCRAQSSSRCQCIMCQHKSGSRHCQWDPTPRATQ